MKRDDQLDLLAPPPTLTREEGLRRLDALVGRDLRTVAAEYDVTVFREGRKNKGWAGHAVEHYLGRGPNSDKAADFGDWELKVVSIVPDAAGHPRPKESMSIAMFTAHELETEAFGESHLYDKLARLVVVGRTFEGFEEARSIVLGATRFDLSDPAIYAQVEEDYEEARWVARSSGTYALSGHIGRLVQPRPKNEGLGFYARPQFVAFMLGLAAEPL